ncbi:hypothetical protein B0H13DRAFT_2521590 [Mycena leptocephala]|nr:hypothetical protein B0H13DRAFT_2521590 [Mycena leptocephala]
MYLGPQPPAHCARARCTSTNSTPRESGLMGSPTEPRARSEESLCGGFSGIDVKSKTETKDDSNADGGRETEDGGALENEGGDAVEEGAADYAAKRPHSQPAPRMRIPTNQGKRVWTACALPNVDDRAQNTSVTGRVTAQGGVQLTRTSGGQLTRAAGSGRAVGNGRELGAMEEWQAVEESGGKWKRKTKEQRTHRYSQPCGLPAIVSRCAVGWGVIYEVAATASFTSRMYEDEEGGGGGGGGGGGSEEDESWLKQAGNVGSSVWICPRLKVAGSFAVKVQLISVTSPEVGLVGTAMVNAHASGEEAMQGCDGKGILPLQCRCRMQRQSHQQTAARQYEHAAANVEHAAALLLVSAAVFFVRGNPHNGTQAGAYAAAVYVFLLQSSSCLRRVFALSID